MSTIGICESTYLEGTNAARKLRNQKKLWIAAVDAAGVQHRNQCVKALQRGVHVSPSGAGNDAKRELLREVHCCPRPQGFHMAQDYTLEYGWLVLASVLGYVRPLKVKNGWISCPQDFALYP